MKAREQAASLKDVAKHAALSVGDSLRAAFRSSMNVSYKADFHDLVTQFDRDTETAIRSLLLSSVPNSVVVGEEQGESGNGEIRWYVDPIDGTSNFASGIAFWCVSIGAVLDNRVVAGVVYDPIADNLFSADLSGVWLNDKPIRSHAALIEEQATLITGYPVARDMKIDGRSAALEHFAVLTETFSTLRRPGSAALSIAHVAAGWADAAAGFGVNAWDVAAAALILKNAGGAYHPLGLGKVPAGSPDYMHPGYVAIGAGASYPTLMRVADTISIERTRRFMPAGCSSLTR